MDSSTNVYVTDQGNNTIRKMTPVGTNWIVTTIAGLAGSSGFADGTNNAARFNYPGGLAVDGNTNIYVADWANSVIRKVTPIGTNWVVTTIGGLAGSYGCTNGIGSAALFGLPNGVAVDSWGNLYVADLNNTIRIGVPLPVFQTMSQSNGTVTFAWSAVAGLNYQVQYQTNLAQGNWTDLGGSITASNSTVRVSDSSLDQQRFYQTLRLP